MSVHDTRDPQPGSATPKGSNFAILHATVNALPALPQNGALAESARTSGGRAGPAIESCSGGAPTSQAETREEKEDTASLLVRTGRVGTPVILTDAPPASEVTTSENRCADTDTHLLASPSKYLVRGHATARL